MKKNLTPALIAAAILAQVIPLGKVHAEMTDETVKLNGSLIIYQSQPDVNRAPIAARLDHVVRYKSYLFVYIDSNSEPEVIPYLTVSRAQAALSELSRGQSIDVSSCMERDEPGESSNYGTCTVTPYTMKMNCHATTSTPLVKTSDLHAVVLRNIAGSPLTTFFVSCLSDLD